MRSTPGNLSAVCICDPGWQGSNCTEPELGQQWSSWSEWSSCSVTCLRGWRKRQRFCCDVSTGVKVNPMLCLGLPVQYKQCDQHNCPRWSQWGEWGQCSTSNTCGVGKKTKRRICLNGGQIGVDRLCLGLDIETTLCYSIHCFGPIRLTNSSSPNEGKIEVYDNMNKKWTSICANQITDYVASLVCKQAGWPGPYKVIHDSRYGSAGVSMSLNSIQCTGSEHSVTACPHNLWTTNAQCSDGSLVPAAVQCNVNGVWSLWSTWSDCSVSCNNGTKSRHRNCDQPKTIYNGVPCQGVSMEQKICLLKTCPVNGYWSSWHAWSDCTLTCGNGTQSRLRQCIGPFHGGDNCSGDYKDNKVCGDKDCPIDGQWEEWSMWLDCTQTCGGGTRKRNRSCNGPYNDGQPCIGTSYDTMQCHLLQCPVDGEWLQWDSWTNCTVACGGGRQSRKRQCQQPLYGGAQCPGDSNETQLCNQQLCPIDGVWSTWAVWSQCSSTCGQGLQQRNRTCYGPFFGGSDCSGASRDSQICNLYNCPVDGQWMEWQSWSLCSVTCGIGKKNRKRDCYLGLYGGNNCTGSFVEEQLCNETSCPVDGKWMTWSSWGQCSQTCGSGSQSRERKCDGPFYGGSNCIGPVNESQSCNNQSCAVDGVWEIWSDWSECSATCGSGKQLRNRECIGPFNGGKNCDGTSSEFRKCNNSSCPENGVLSQWSSWGHCNVSCGGGFKERLRVCIGPFYGGLDCQDVLIESMKCNVQQCLVDGILTGWGDWSTCSATCMGTHSRNRTCIEPLYGGKECQGSLFESQPCSNISCAVDGTWSTWSLWGDCSQSCGNGSKIRSRECIGLQNGGKYCSGDSQESSLCNSQKCPVDAIFSQWSSWTACTLSCGSGQQNRNRTCIGPFYGGKKCYGDFDEFQICNDIPCPIDGYFLTWSEWNNCTETCNGGIQYRNRTCIPPLYGGQNCQGVNYEHQACNNNPCPVDGYYTEWGHWSQCTATCGGGTHWRKRSCIPPIYGGLDCTGLANVTENCNFQPCPIDGFWLSWSQWSSCSATCGGGQQQKTRLCQEPLYGGKTCDGMNAEYLRCSENPCPIPGLWLPWSPWTPCSATCGGGSHIRERICNTTSYGNLTAPCPGSDKEKASCHTFNCLPLARTCTELRKKGLIENVMAEVDPDGPDLYSLEPVMVYCDMVSHNESGVTVIGHNQESRTDVQGWEGAREYEAVLVYNVSFEHAISIVDQSSYCEQYIRWECYAALIHNYNDNNKITTGWLNRTKGVADYFGDAPPGSNNCTCGTRHACVDPSYGCNCDANDHVWRVDDGYMTFKDDLPVYAFVAGDTGGSDEEGYSTVGPLRCWGPVQKNP